MRSQNKPQKNLSKQPIASLIKDPSPKDVLCGRGGKCNQAQGNRHYQEVVERYSEVYSALKGRHAKTELSWKVYRELQADGVRFIRKDKGGKFWSLAPEEECRKKISQRLRELVLQSKKEEGVPTKETKATVSKGADQMLILPKVKASADQMLIFPKVKAGTDQMPIFPKVRADECRSLASNQECLSKKISQLARELVVQSKRGEVAPIEEAKAAVPQDADQKQEAEVALSEDAKGASCIRTTLDNEDAKEARCIRMTLDDVDDESVAIEDWVPATDFSGSDESLMDFADDFPASWTKTPVPLELRKSSVPLQAASGPSSAATFPLRAPSSLAFNQFLSYNWMILNSILKTGSNGFNSGNTSYSGNCQNGVPNDCALPGMYQLPQRNESW